MIVSAVNCLNAQVTVDWTFNANTRTTVREIVEQPDGKILIGGSSFAGGSGQQRGIIRLNEDGTFNTAFYATITGSIVYAVALQSDGRILIGGSFTTVNGQSRFNLARLNADGTLDTTFAVVNPDNLVRDIVVQPDGKILIAGVFYTVGGQQRSNLVRLNTDGTLDDTFDPKIGSGIYALALQPDGKILVGKGYIVGGQPPVRVLRLNADGTVDTTFSLNFNDPVNTIVLQPNGKILIGGSTRPYLTRLNEDGTIDSSFNPGFDGEINAVAVQPSGKILVGGFFNFVNGRRVYNFVRLNANGIIDDSFAANFGGTVYAITVISNNQILVGGGFSFVEDSPHSGIARLNPEASPVELPIIGIDSVALSEGNSTTTAFNFTISVLKPSNVPVIVDYFTSDQSAVAPFDYQSAYGKFTFLPGEKAKTFTVLVNGDTDAERNETFKVYIVANLVNATIVNDGGIGTIENDDSCAFSLSSASVNFGSASANGAFNITTGSICAYTAVVSDAPFITITSGNNGTGSGTIAYSVAANLGAARTGTISVGGQTFTVNQAAAKSRKRIRFF